MTIKALYRITFDYHENSSNYIQIYEVLEIQAAAAAAAVAAAAAAAVVYLLRKCTGHLSYNNKRKICTIINKHVYTYNVIYML